MQTLRFYVILSAVLIAAGATVALAYGLAWIGAPVWQAAIGPALLVLMLLVRWIEHRKVSTARKGADFD